MRFTRTYRHFQYLFLLLFCSFSAFSQETTAADGDYSDPATWTGGVPDSEVDDILITHDVILDVDIVVEANFEVQGSLIESGAAHLEVLNFGSLTVGSIVIDHLDVEDDATMTVKSGDTIYVDRLHIKNDGTLIVEPGAVVYTSEFKVVNNAQATINGEVYVTDKFEVKNAGNVSGDGFVQAGTKVKINSSGTVFGSSTECVGCLYMNGCVSNAFTVWTGSTSTDWFSAANWSNGIPDANTPVRIPSGLSNYPVVTGTATCFFLDVSAGSTFEISGSNRLNVHGNVNMQGTFTPNTSTIALVSTCNITNIDVLAGTQVYNLELDNTSGAAILSGQLNLLGSFDILNGSFDTNDSLTVVSGPLGTGRIGEIMGTGVITGEIVMERYIDAGETNWRFFASAVQGATVSQYNDDFTTAGYTGSHFPTFPFTSVWTYTESLGAAGRYQPIGSAGDVIGVGQGLQVYCGDTIIGTTPFIVDLRGVPNQGAISLPVTFTNTGDPATDGYCLVGNPYPSTIDWDATNWTKSNMDNAVYIFDPDTELFASYVGGASANGGSRYIASQQCFWVKANAASPTLNIVESCKATNDANFFRAGESTNPGSNISMSGFGMENECVLRNTEEATQDFDGQYDALAMTGGWGVQPQITLLNPTGKEFTIQSFDFGHSEWEVPMKVVVFTSGTYYLEFKNIEELNVPCVVLEDTYDGSTYTIEESVALPFEMSDTTYAPRFIIHIGKSYESTVTKASCNGNFDGSIEIDLDLPSATIELDGPVGVSTFTSPADPLEIDGLNSGIYHITVPELDDLCETMTFDFYLGEPSAINTNAVIEPEVFGNDGSILLNTLGGTPPYTFLWNTGAMTQSIDGLSSGYYTVLIEDAHGCEVEEIFNLTSAADITEIDDEQPHAFYNSFTDQIVISNWPDNSLNAVLYDISGKRIQAYTEGVSDGSAMLNLPYGLKSGTYILVAPEYGFSYKVVLSR